jgi:hypothetical protein
VTDAGARPDSIQREGAACPLCLDPGASSARITTFRQGAQRNVIVVDCHDCGIFVFHDDTLADGPLSTEALRRLRGAIHRGSLYNTPCDVTRGLVTQVRSEQHDSAGPPAI